MAYKANGNLFLVYTVLV